MKNYIVISYCEEEGETFFDPVKASSAASARKIASTVRGDYSTIIRVLDAEDILFFAGCLSEDINHLNGDFYLTKSNCKARKEFLR